MWLVIFNLIWLLFNIWECLEDATKWRHHYCTGCSRKKVCWKSLIVFLCYACRGFILICTHSFKYNLIRYITQWHCLVNVRFRSNLHKIYCIRIVISSNRNAKFSVYFGLEHHVFVMFFYIDLTLILSYITTNHLTFHEKK